MDPTTSQPGPAPPVARKPAYQDWPTIKVLSVPKGKFSRDSDEWCATFCTQSVTGRFHGQQPSCRSICIRKVFPHEVKNILSYKRHNNIGPDGKARFPLPDEGQPQNVPRLLGGQSPSGSGDEGDQASSSRSTESTKHWDEGYYLWTSSNPRAAWMKIATMQDDLANADKRSKTREKSKQVWDEYMEYIERRSSSKHVELQDKDQRWYGDITPPRPLPDAAQDSLLVRFPPEFPIWEQMNRLLDPSRHALGLFHEAITSGDMQRFAERAFEKACSTEPWVLASRAFSQSMEVLRGKGDDDDDGKRGPP